MNLYISAKNRAPHIFNFSDDERLQKCLQYIIYKVEIK